MIMPIKYTDEMVAEALAMRARGEKQAVVHATFGAGIESAMRRVRERDEGPRLLERIKALGRSNLVRRSDGQRYQVFRTRGRMMGGRSAAYLVPVWGGNSHWKTHERILLDFTDINGEPL